MSKICDMGKAGLKDILDAIVFFMSLYPAPLSKAIMLAQLGEDFSRTALNTDLDRLCKKGFISKLKDKRNIFLKI
jgi:hypothetical protein